jgi:hypothetical protein
MSKQNNNTNNPYKGDTIMEQFNSQILQSVHDLLTDPELQHIDKKDLMYYITTEIQYRCEEAVSLIEERHAYHNDSIDMSSETRGGKE